jgi:hypothetical protein
MRNKTEELPWGGLQQLNWCPDADDRKLRNWRKYWENWVCGNADWDWETITKKNWDGKIEHLMTNWDRENWEDWETWTNKTETEKLS